MKNTRERVEIIEILYEKLEVKYKKMYVFILFTPKPIKFDW